MGAKAVIIMDNKYENVKNIIMIDDGSAGNIFIPSMLISKQDGDIIIKYLNEQQPVILLLNFEMAKAYSVVHYELWMTSSNPLVREFL